MHKLYSFGFNAFGQTGNKTALPNTSIHENIKKVLYANWQVTIGLTHDNSQLFVWGLESTLTRKLREVCQTRVPVCMFGDPDRVMGFVDSHETLYLITPTLECSFEAICHAVYSQQCVFMLDHQGRVKRLDCQNLARSVPEVLVLPPVNSIHASDLHVLFLTDSVNAPVYGLGANKLSQLGSYSEHEAKQPIVIDYFCGFMTKAHQASCGLFHSAVILNGDVYTFGWSKDGRLGSGSADSQEESISLGQFLDDQDQPVEVYAIQVSCGSTHTLVLDDQGQVWSCGSNKYAQLGRKTKPNDNHFRKVDHVDSKAKSCFAGHWSTFVTTL